MTCGHPMWLVCGIYQSLVCGEAQGERAMESDEKVEMIKKAINKLMMELEDNDEIKSLTADDGDNAASRRQLLSKLLSELEWLEQDKEEASEEIIKEVKKVQRQNSITHYLLTGMIVITVAWQLSQVSLILKIKQGLSNPFKSVGEMAKGFFLKGKGGGKVNSVEDVMKAASDVVQPALKLPNLDLSSFDTTDEEDETRKIVQN